ncbi:MAG: hypothetical protein HQL32_16310 [Planctomycetes bacterium]|nr:hypothetical protein [Planctomycetota bacterium]
MIFSAITVYLIERKFLIASIWCFLASFLSVLGLMHGFVLNGNDAVLKLGPAWPWAQAYALLGLVFLLAIWLVKPSEDFKSSSDQKERLA